MKRVAVVGDGTQTRELVRLLRQAKGVTLVGVAEWPADVATALAGDPDLVVVTARDPQAVDAVRERAKGAAVVWGEVADALADLAAETARLRTALEKARRARDVILDATHDAVLAVDAEGRITLFNRAAETITGLKREDVLGRRVTDVIPSSRLLRVLETGQAERNQEQRLDGGRRIVTNRTPVVDENGKVVGAVAVFRDITDVMALAEQVTNLKEVRSLLEAIIHATEDAISVVDARGIGILINPAYTRLTGLTEEDVIGKPADVDISEGESMHMKVLRTRKPVRGVPLKVGPKKKDVIVNVAPIIVDGELKGSVGVIHDVSEIKRLNAELEQAKKIIRTLEAKYTFEDIIGESDALRIAVEQAKKAAKTTVTVLLRGESGTGKELFAHAIHNASDRKYNQFVRVNCAALTESLLESELFGYEEGAFTGARRGGKRGLFEEASGGTIFLDEIGELSLNMQAKLLRVLQEKEVVRVGGTKPIPVDVRVIAATNVNLERAIQQGTFREDLYYRLNVFPIFIPPLRYRKEDIPLLCAHLIRKFNQEYGRMVKSVDPAALEVLSSYTWPGNVRELENILGRAIINMKFNETVIRVSHLPPLDQQGGTVPAHSQRRTDGPIEPLEAVVRRAEAEHIARALDATGGNKTEAARLLGISVRNLYYKLNKLGLNRDSGEGDDPAPRR
ncbi:sigma-54-dependent Fis family transcriptional regulator [Calditerricola yamamurae]